MTTPLPARIGMLTIAALVGAVYGVVGTVGHGSQLLGLPLGLVLALIGAAALLLAIRLLVGRWPAVAAGAGMTVAIVVFSGEGPGGSVIAPAGALATVWTIACPLIAVLIVLWPEMPTPGGGSAPTDENAAP